MAVDPDKYEVCFLKLSGNENISDKLQIAFDAMVNHDLDPVWVTDKYCLNIKKKELKLFVLDPFEGQVFAHLKSLNCRIVGPLCVLTCLQLNEALPKRPYPVYSVAMRGLTITCSNLDKALREDLCSKIQLMGGNFSKDLTKSVTHLVVGDVGSKKYQVAANFELPIMLREWIQELWNNGQYNQIRVSDSSYEKYKCPIFKGLCITISQLGSEERSLLKSKIEENGGRYLGALKSKETTHLVLMENSGDKYNFAKSWKLPCVKVDWLYDSLKYGYCRDENLYQLDETAPKRSTPIKDKEDEKLSVDFSAINFSVISHLDETTKPDYSIIFKNKLNSSLNDIDEFDLSSLPKSGQFLDGCKIYLCGFKGLHLDKLRKIVNFGGASRFSSYSDSVSHVVCRAKDEQLFDSIKKSSFKPHVVTFHWLLECGKLQKIVDEGPFCFPELYPSNVEELEDKTLSSSGNITVLPDNTIKKPSFETTSKDNSAFKKDGSIPSDFTVSLLKQYSTDNKQSSPIKNENKQNQDSVNKEKCLDNQGAVQLQSGISQVETTKHENSAKNMPNREQMQETLIKDQSDVTYYQMPTIDKDVPPDNINFNENDMQSNLFKGKTFQVVDFGDNEIELLSNMIALNGGDVLNNQTNVKTDVAVVPLTWESHEINAIKIITNCWLQKCIEENSILPFNSNELFAPINVSNTKQPLKHCVISVSQYVGTERDCLMHLAEMLGACCQDYFVRKANQSRGLLPNTHLVICTAEGSKYEAAKKWNIPAVTKDWLLTAAKLDAVPPEEKFSVDVEFTNDKSSNADLFSNMTVDTPNTASKINSCVQKFDAVTTPTNDSKSVKDTSCKNVNDENIKPNYQGKRPLSEDDYDEVFIVPNNRVTELIHSDRKSSPKKLRSSVSSRNSSDSDIYVPKFDISGMLAGLNSLEDSNNKIKLQNQSLPLEEKITRNLRSTLNRAGCRLSSDGSPLVNQKHITKEEESKVLENVVLSVSKKLSKLQSDINKIVVFLGGQFRWTYDQSCTHFVFQGKVNDLSKEFKDAKKNGKKIVSPDWVYACKEANSHVDEESYPHTFKSRLSLVEQVLTSKGSKSEDKSFSKSSQDQPQSPLKDSDGMDYSKPLAEDDNNVDTSKDLDNLMVAVKSAKAGKRRCRLRTNSNSPIDKHKSSPSVTSNYSNIYNNCEFKSNIQTVEAAIPAESTQSVPITWDDPTGRKEREMIAAEIDDPMNDQNGDSDFTPSRLSSISDSYSSQFLSLRNEKSNVVRKFMFTSYSESEKAKFSAIICELGGIVADCKVFDGTATHLIMGKPLRNEKFLASVASGKWLLHHSYLIDSMDSKCFLPEEAYEWGSTFTESFIQNLSTNSLKISMCPRRWRLKLSKHGKNSKAFQSWKVVVICDDNTKKESFLRILKAGGAEIFDVSVFKSSNIKLTYAFVELEHNSDNLHYVKLLASRNVNCIKPDYFAYYLINDPLLPIQNYIIPQMKKFLQSSNLSPTSDTMER